MAYQNKKEAKARIDPQADPIAVILHYQLNLKDFLNLIPYFTVCSNDGLSAKIRSCCKII